MRDDLDTLGCSATAAAVAARQCSAVEVVDAALQRIAARDGSIGAFLNTCAEAARQRARQIDADAALRRLPLAGVPIALKDNICVAGRPTSAGSRILADYRPPYTATVVERLRAAGAVIIGNTNMDEFAMGSSNENSAYQATLNPWDTGRVPGGSSGGSAAAVAAGMVAGALGSDTGGSVRQPAALCGVVGCKPTYGRISRYGLIAFASSLDQIGPLTRNVEDTALLLSVMAGDDDNDSTTSAAAVPAWHEELDADAADFTIGVPEAWLGDGVDTPVADAVRGILDELEDAGARVRPISLPHQRFAVPTYYVIATAEASSNLARFDGVRYGFRSAAAEDLDAMYANTRSEGFGAEVKRRILLGTFVLSAGYYDAYYGHAQRVRTLLRNDFAAAFEDVDVVLGPTAPSTAFAIGEKADDPVAMYLSDVFTVTANLTGLPAVSVPCGHDSAGLPIGLQIHGAELGELKMLQVARIVEQMRGPWEPAPLA